MRTFYYLDSQLHIKNIEDIFKKPITIVVNNFGEDDLKNFEKEMDEAHNTSQSVIPVVVNSYGGSTYGVLGFIAAIESAKKPVATIVTAKAFSAGAILFAFGTEGYRFMHPDAHLMIHDLSACSFGKIEEIKSDINHSNHLNDLLYTKMSKQIGHHSQYIQEQIKKHNHVDWFLNAKEAKKHNIANHLKTPCFNVNINLEVNFD